MQKFLPAVLLCCLAMPAFAAPDFVTQPLSKVAIHLLRTASAQVVSLNESRLSAEIAARVASIAAEPGQAVAKGALLAELDCTDYQLASERAAAALQASEARAKLAELQLERSRKLAEQNFISPSGLDTQQAQTESARADVAVSRSALDTAKNAESKCEIRAPFRGVVLKRIAQVGEMLAPGTPVLELRDLSRLEVRAELQEKDRSIRQVNDIRLVTPEGSYPLELIRVSPALDTGTRLLEARLRFRDNAARSGSNGRIEWRSSETYLPGRYVVRREGKLGVFIVEQGKPRFVPLPSAEEGRPAETGGLDDKSLVVVEGQETL